MSMKRKHLFILCCLLLLHITTFSQTPTLQDVTNVGNTTTQSISISNENGLSLGVDASTGYTVKSHFIRPLNANYRTIRLDCSTIDGNGGWEFYNSNANQSLMYVKQNGNVGIGIADPHYKLAVNGVITAEKVRVTKTPWADFVFQPGYDLPSLQELETFIKKNKHLPDIPSEEQVKAYGIDVGETQARLLQKIEELTLYLIELNNKVNAQQQLILEQNKELNQLKKKVLIKKNE